MHLNFLIQFANQPLVGNSYKREALGPLQNAASRPRLDFEAKGYEKTIYMLLAILCVGALYIDLLYFF